MDAKRPRTLVQHPSLPTAVGVLLDRCSAFLTGHSMQKTLLALLLTDQATRSVVVTWLNESVMRDITRRNEALPTPVHLTAHLRINHKLQLLRFIYVKSVRVPLPRQQHELDMDQQERLRVTNPDVERVIRGRRVHLYAAFTEATGWAIHAAQRIAQGEYMGEYTGELISSAEARRRHEAEYDHFKLNYVLALREQTARADVIRTNVDASRFGNYTRFFNHSCEPTLRVEAVRVDSLVPRLVFFTSRDVEDGEELTFDYGHAAAAPRGSPADTDVDTIARQRVPCRCRAETCRGSMPFDGSL